MTVDIVKKTPSRPARSHPHFCLCPCAPGTLCPFNPVPLKFADAINLTAGTNSKHHDDTNRLTGRDEAHWMKPFVNSQVAQTDMLRPRDLARHFCGYLEERSAPEWMWKNMHSASGGGLVVHAESAHLHWRQAQVSSPLILGVCPLGPLDTQPRWTSTTLRQFVAVDRWMNNQVDGSSFWYYARTVVDPYYSPTWQPNHLIKSTSHINARNTSQPPHLPSIGLRDKYQCN